MAAGAVASAACRVLGAKVSAHGRPEAVWCNDCVTRLAGSCWRGDRFGRDHVDDVLRRGVWPELNATLAELLMHMDASPRWLACLSRPACASLPRAERLALLWRSFLGLLGLSGSLLRRLPPPAPFVASVALVVRAFAGAVSTLLPFLRSVELFWPISRWPVVIVLDAESEPDRFLASSLVPEWAQVVFEPHPPHLREWVELRRKGSRIFGWQRASWSHFNLDRYSSAEFIAQMDADTLFHTWVDEELLFDDFGRPHVTGISHWSDFSPVLHVMGLQTDFDFMAAQPMVLRRDHFEETRAFVAAKLEADDFDQAYALLTHEVMRNETPGTVAQTRHVPSQQSVMGGYLWKFRRESYSWHVLWRFPERALHAGSPYPRSPPWWHRCPQLYVASHLNCWGQRGDCVGLKQGGGGAGTAATPRKAPAALADLGGEGAMPRHSQGGQHYLLKSSELLVVALCSARDALRAQGSAGGGAEGAEALADLLLVAPNPPAVAAGTWAGATAAAASAAEAAPSPPPGESLEALCASARAAAPRGLLFGLSNTAFWPEGDEADGAAARPYCATRGELLEHWEAHAARAAARFLAARKRRRPWPPGGPAPPPAADQSPPQAAAAAAVAAAEERHQSVGGGGFWLLRRGCPSAPGLASPGAAARRAWCRPPSSRAAVRCCRRQDDGNGGHRRPGAGAGAGAAPSARGYGCHSAASHSEAAAICDAQGLRLCTASELEAGLACGAGCFAFDRRLAWTSTACGGGGGAPPL